MHLFSLLFRLKLCECLLKTTDNLSRSLQRSSLSATAAQHIASLTITTLTTMRTDDAFRAFYQLLKSLSGTYDVEQSCFPWKRKVPRRYNEGISNGDFNETVEDYYRRQYFGASLFGGMD